MAREANYFLAALQKAEGIGRRYLRRMLDAFDNAEEIWRADAAELHKKAGLPLSVAESAVNFCRQNPDEPKRLARFCLDHEFKLYALNDPEYPPSLKEIFDPPACFFCWGELPTEIGVGIVGSRKATAYGLGVAEKISRELAAAGMVVISGAARGIDTAAHKGALKSGKTVAVLGCGLDMPYPPENRQLLRQIATEGGAVISEFLPGTPPLAGNFPTRNRIISGLSKGILVVEAPIKSGALITAELAISNNRDVFAVPGSIYSVTSEGCNRLIQHGAKLVMSAGDVLEEYGISKKKAPPRSQIPPNLSEDEAAVYRILSVDQPMSIDDIIIKSGRGEVSHVAQILFQMEMNGYIKSDDYREYVRVEGK